MFGIKIFTNAKFEEVKREIRQQEYSVALSKLIEVLSKSDKVFLKPVKMNGDGCSIVNCMLLDTEVSMNGDGQIVINNVFEGKGLQINPVK
jgi:hypothetical protein